jgi:CubicO group peptidase (beta-lactamase class C family)
MKRLLIVLGALTVALAALYFSWYGYLFNGVYATYLQGRTTSDPFDETLFDVDSVSASPNPVAWPVGLREDLAPSEATAALLASSKTGAVLVFESDTLRHEAYFDDFQATSRVNSFSMAKSIVTMLVQIAVQEGKIPGWEAKAKTYIPELHGPGAARLTLRDLSSMRADLDWTENYYDPFGETAKLYYGDDQMALILEREVGDSVGLRYEYQSAATTLLSVCLEKAVGESLAAYAARKLWAPLGAESDATWHVDGTGEAMAFCCFNATARDYARLGHLLVHHGNWKGSQIIDSAWVSVASSPMSAAYYGQSFWLGEVAAPDGVGAARHYVALRGHLGQWIIAFPETGRVVVRLGRTEGERPKGSWEPVPFRALAEEYAWK